LREKRPAFLQRSFLLERGKRVNNPRRLALSRGSAAAGELQEQTSTSRQAFFTRARVK
jgi:hypothetical protein